MFLLLKCERVRNFRNSNERAHVEANYDINKITTSWSNYMSKYCTPSRNLHMPKVRSKIPAVE